MTAHPTGSTPTRTTPQSPGPHSPGPHSPGPRAGIRDAGDRALLVLPAPGDDPAAVVDVLRRSTPTGVQDLLAAAETVLVTLTRDADRGATRAALLRLLDGVRTPEPGDVAPEPDELTIAVRYDGADLTEAAELLGMSRDRLIAEHTSRTWRCAFLGFAPGFGYLEADRPGLTVPRLPQARTAIPAGAVALADGYSAVYPRRSPGGWQLIGTTDAPMWDLDRPDPALLRPGTVVRFVQEPRS